MPGSPRMLPAKCPVVWRVVPARHPNVQIFLELLRVHDPDHFSVERFTFTDALRTDRRVLKFDNDPAVPNDVGPVWSDRNLAALRTNYLLPVQVPFGFAFAPRVAIRRSQVGPMPSFDLPTLSDQTIFTVRTNSWRSRSCLNSTSGLISCVTHF